MTRTTKILAGLSGLVIVGGTGWWMTRSPQKTVVSASQTTHQKSPDKTRPRTVEVKTPGNPGVPNHSAKKSGTHSLSLAASFQAQSHQALPTGVQALSVPWHPHTAWVFVPQAIQGQLWFGQKIGTGSWHWTSEDLPGMLSRQLPPPVYDTLQWAADLHANAPGPHLPGAVQWNVITGRVGEPVGWTTQILPANQSPVGHKALELTVWLPSETGVFSGVYGIETLWDGHNSQTGHGALLMLTAAPQVPGKGGTP